MEIFNFSEYGRSFFKKGTFFFISFVNVSNTLFKFEINWSFNSFVLKFLDRSFSEGDTISFAWLLPSSCSSSWTNSNWLSSLLSLLSLGKFEFVFDVGSISFLNSWRKSKGLKFKIDGFFSSYPRDYHL